MCGPERSGGRLAGLLRRYRGCLRLLGDPAHGVDERREVIPRGRSRFKGGCQTDNLPAERRGEVMRVFVAQVVRVRVGNSREGTDNDRRVAIVVVRVATATLEQPGLEQWRWAITPLRVRHSVPVSPASARHTPTLRGCFLRAAMSSVATATVAVRAVPCFSRGLQRGGRGARTLI